MKPLLKYINEAQGHKRGALVFPNISSLLLYVYELEGQISDGKYENSSPLDHWKWVLDIKTFKVGKVPGLYLGSSVPGKWNSNTKRFENVVRSIKWTWDSGKEISNTLSKACKAADIDQNVYNDVLDNLRLPSKKYNIDDFVTQYITNAEKPQDERSKGNEHTEWSYRLIGYGALGQVCDKSQINSLIKYQNEIRSLIESASIDWLDNKDITSDEIISNFEKFDYLKKYYDKCKSFLNKELLDKWLNKMKEYTKKELKKDLKKMNLTVNTIISANYMND